MFMILISFPAVAKEVLTWSDCVKIVSKNNPDIRSSYESLRSQESLSRSAYSGFFPKLSANYSISKGTAFSFSEVSGSPTSFFSTGTTSNTSSASLSATQNLFAGFQDSALVSQGSAGKEVASAQYDITKVQVSYSLRTAFAELLYAQNYLTLSRDIVKRRAQNADMVELRYESGIENKGSYLLAKALLGQAKYDVLVAKDLMRVASQKLMAVLGRSELDEVELSGDEPTSTPPTDPNFQKLATDTPELRQATFQAEKSEAGVTLARSKFFPNLNAVGATSAQGGGWSPENGKNSIGLNISLPLLNGGKDYYDYKSSVAVYSSSSYQKTSVAQQLLPKLKSAYSAYVEAVEKLNVDKAFLDAGIVRAEIATSKYENGLMSFEDWDIIENDLITKQKNVLQSDRNRVAAEAGWEQAQGKGVIR